MVKTNKPILIYAVYKEDIVVYIGQTTTSLIKRAYKHKSEANLGRGAVLGAAIRKHGFEKFDFRKHSVFYNQREADLSEKHFIAKYAPKYNVSPGGKFQTGWTWNKGRKEDRQDVKRNISEAAKNRKRYKRGKQTEDVIKRRSEARVDIMRKKAKPFICNQNGKVYTIKMDAALDLGIDVRGIVAVLCETHNLTSYKGYTFQYL